jgi:hypothetical protein
MREQVILQARFAALGRNRRDVPTGFGDPLGNLATRPPRLRGTIDQVLKQGAVSLWKRCHPRPICHLRRHSRLRCHTAKVLG